MNKHDPRLCVLCGVLFRLVFAYMKHWLEVSEPQPKASLHGCGSSLASLNTHTHTLHSEPSLVPGAGVYLSNLEKNSQFESERDGKTKGNEKNSILGTIDGEAYKNTFFYIKEKAIL